MSLFGSLMADVEDDPFFGSHMRHMRQMNNMMNSLFSDPFGMLGGGGPLAIGAPRHGSALMPFMPQMPSINRLFTGMPDMDGHMSAGSSFSSSTVVMSSGPNGKPQVYSSSSSTKIGPNGVKETRKTLQDTRTGTKKMSIGHHIGERAHVVERAQNVYSGEAEECQEYINIEEEEAEEFDREFQIKAGSGGNRSRLAIAAPPSLAAPLAIAAPPPAHSTPAHTAHTAHAHAHNAHNAHTAHTAHNAHNAHAHNAHAHQNIISEGARRASNLRPSTRRPLRPNSSPLTLPSSSRVRELYSSAHPARSRHRHHKHRSSPTDN